MSMSNAAFEGLLLAAVGTAAQPGPPRPGGESGRFLPASQEQAAPARPVGATGAAWTGEVAGRRARGQAARRLHA